MFGAKCATTSAAGISLQNVWVIPILDILHEILADASRTLQSLENGMHARWTQFGTHIKQSFD